MASRKFISILCWLFLSTCAVTNAQWTPQTEIESRNLDQIYEEARLEAGDLKIFAGGDGMLSLSYSKTTTEELGQANSIWY